MTSNTRSKSINGQRHDHDAMVTRAGQLANTRMKLDKYNARGMTHSRGMAATLRVRWVVTPKQQSSTE